MIIGLRFWRNLVINLKVQRYSLGSRHGNITHNLLAGIVRKQLQLPTSLQSAYPPIGIFLPLVPALQVIYFFPARNFLSLLLFLLHNLRPPTQIIASSLFSFPTALAIPMCVSRLIGVRANYRI